ncbi:hypothetical protein DI09_45p180 [Mitosporidium daphniae]|uniref:Autophagy-related protein 13 n=1 Tax=Mitosporidium daphniae TaxID=1485682 RepID=A0A098VTN9_9MICR|nr:uncharacterized protein DI09_45p180 [Mitosporidium daphniae]KGG51091.1 hypothetical protein DI09_45p180 [Mitosporidium daphniae]|eukprot:XP_013237518.1 uncharacterized protein DI09_45p180 [Mitosporidium daphniae]
MTAGHCFAPHLSSESSPVISLYFGFEINYTCMEELALESLVRKTSEGKLGQNGDCHINSSSIFSKRAEELSEEHFLEALSQELGSYFIELKSDTSYATKSMLAAIDGQRELSPNLKFMTTDRKSALYMDILPEKFIPFEQWEIYFAPISPSKEQLESLPSIYKKATLLIRSIMSICGLLPLSSLFLKTDMVDCEEFFKPAFRLHVSGLSHENGEKYTLKPLACPDEFPNVEAEKKELPLFGGKPRSECRSTCVLKKGNDFATLAPAAEDGDDSTFPGFASCVKVPSLLENEIISKKQTPFSVHVRDSVQVDPSQGDYPPFALSYPKIEFKRLKNEYKSWIEGVDICTRDSTAVEETLQTALSMSESFAAKLSASSIDKATDMDRSQRDMFSTSKTEESSVSVGNLDSSADTICFPMSLSS